LAKTYDTAELRRIASVIQESSEDVSKTLRNTTKWIRDDVPEHLSGETADALAETVGGIHEELTALSEETDKIGMQLRQYAFLLDQADRKIAEMIQSK
jgi:uncharacterized protein YukE